MKLRLLFGIAIVLTFATASFALDPERRFDQYVRRTWLAVDGLPQNSVTAIVQSTDGYLWLGTWGGLARFDGVTFESFDTGDSPALRSSRIIALSEDERGRLWIGTERGGLVRYENGHFERVPLTDGVDVSVYAIARGPAGSMWVGTERGAFRFDRDTSRRFTVLDGLPSNDVTSILFLADGTALFGTMSGTVAYKDETFTLLGGELGTVSVRSMIETSDGSVYLGGNQGLYRMDETETRRIPLGATFAENEVVVLYEDNDSTVWAGRPGQGLLRIREGEIEVIGRRDGLSSGSIRAVFEDRENNLWIGTDGGGLMMVRDGKAITWGGPYSPLGKSIVPIETDGRGGLWIGMACGGLGHLAADESITVMTKSDGLHSDCIWALLRDSEGTLWIGSSGEGVATWDGRVFTRIDDPVGRGLNVNVIFEDSEGRIWAGSGKGLLQYDSNANRFVQVTGTESHHVSNIYQARDGTLWIATTRGILIFDGTIREVINAADGLANEFVRAIHEDDEGVFWIGTYGGGLHRIERGQISQFGSRDGLFDDNISRIFESLDGELWMSGNKGISRVLKSDIEAYLAGRLPIISGEVIGTYDGMITAECNGGGQPSGIRTADGKMWFPTVDGIVMIDPSRIRRNTLPPPVYLESVRVGGGPIEAISPVVLEQGSRNLEIHYTGLSFAAPERVRFRYRLDGFDADWVDAGTRRIAYYPFIPPGEYTFQVSASNNDGVWNEEGASFQFSLEPRLHQRPWVWALALLLAVALLHLFNRIRVARFRHREEALGRIVAERTEELEEANRVLQQLASIDSLTGVANHRRFRDFLSTEWRRCLREGAPLTVAIADIDYFKRFNDTYGHQAGDECLTRVATAMSALLQRPTDILARYGGEEFVAVVAGSSQEEANRLAERLRSVVEQLGIPHAASHVASIVTVTVGVFAAVPTEGMTMDDLIYCADVALYEGKRQGRNQVVAGRSQDSGGSGPAE